MTDQLRQRLIGSSGLLEDPSWEIAPADWVNLSTHTTQGVSDNGAADIALLQQPLYVSLKATPAILNDRLQVAQRFANYSYAVAAFRDPYVIDMTKRFSFYYSAVNSYHSSYQFDTLYILFFLTQAESNALTHSTLQGSSYVSPSNWLKSATAYAAYNYVSYLTMPNRPSSAVLTGYPMLGKLTSTYPSTQCNVINWDWDPSTSQWNIYRTTNVNHSDIVANGTLYYKASTPISTYTWDYTTQSNHPNETKFCPAWYGGSQSSSTSKRGGFEIFSAGVHYY